MNILGHGSKQTASSHTNSTLVTNNHRRGEKYYKESACTHTLFTWTRKKNAGNIYLFKPKTTPNNKMSAKKKYFTINFTLSDTNCPHQSVSLCPYLQSVPSYSSHQLLTFPSSSLPFHNILPSVPSTAMDMQHFLKTFSHFRWDALPCHRDQTD